ncbi:MAG: hypothetical protein V4819_06085 [Verrucomicrobiota bacterium]
MKLLAGTTKLPALAAAGGLVLGLLCRPQSGPKSSLDREPVAKNSTAARAGKSPVGNRSARRESGPTTVFLNELASVPAGRCEELFRELVDANDPRRALELEAVFRRWMDLEEPKDLLARLAAERKSDSIWAAPFFEAWASINYAAAVAGTPDGVFSEIRSLVAIRRGDPSFLNSLVQIGNSDDSPMVIALTTLGRDDPELAKGVATCNHGKPDNNADLIAVVARGWAAKDPVATLEWLKSLELTDDHRTQALNELFLVWMKSDVSGATAALKANALDAKSTNRIRSNDPLGYLATPGSSTSQIFLGIHLDPFLDLASLYQQLSKSPVDWEKRQSAQSPIDHDGWFCTDPAKAAEEATRLPPGKARDFIMSYICGQWADRNPDEATAYAKSHGIAVPYVSDDPSAAMVQAALSSPQEAFAGFFTPREPGVALPGSLKTLAGKWAAADPQATAEWLISQPESVTYSYEANSEARSLLNNTVGYHWVRNDAIGASNWVEDLPDGPRKTQAWFAAHGDVGDYCPDLAFAISADILQGDTRIKYLESDLKKVAQKVGQPAARELVQTTNISPEERAVLIQALDEMAPKPR